jgi:hypothetical protein
MRRSWIVRRESGCSSPWSGWPGPGTVTSSGSPRRHLAALPELESGGCSPNYNFLWVGKRALQSPSPGQDPGKSANHGDTLVCIFGSESSQLANLRERTYTRGTRGGVGRGSRKAVPTCRGSDRRPHRHAGPRPREAAQPERIRKVDRIPVGIPIQVQPPASPMGSSWAKTRSGRGPTASAR